MMSRIRINIVANTVGRGWSLLLGVAILPLYVRFLGAESYGLVGLYATIAVVCSLFDAGISASLGRELARVSAEELPGKARAELMRTAETLYFGIGLGLGTAVSLAAPLIVTKWLNLETIDSQQATRAVRLMGLLLVFQWATGLYLGALSALQKQVESNVITSVATSIRAVGSVLVLWKISPTIVAFYWWQVAATAAYLLVSREAVWRINSMQRPQASFRWSVAHRVRRFAAGITLLSFVSVASSQLDKIVLTRLVSLESFGYYSFAASIAGAVTFFGQPVLTALYPAMIEAFTRRESVRLTSLFHRGAQLVSVTTFAPAAVLCAFSAVVLRLWARTPSTAVHASTLVSACLVGAALNSAAVMPYNLTLAAGRVRPAMIAAAGGVIVSGITLIALGNRLGALAGAIATALAAFVGLAVYAWTAVRELLPGETRSWLFTDIFVPLAVAGAVASLVRASSRSAGSLQGQSVALLAASMLTLLCVALLTPVARHELALRARTLCSFGQVNG